MYLVHIARFGTKEMFPLVVGLYHGKIKLMPVIIVALVIGQKYYAFKRKSCKHQLQINIKIDEIKVTIFFVYFLNHRQY